MGVADLAGREVRGHRSPVAGLRIGNVGTYPPTMCGIATFSRSVGAAIGDASDLVVVSCVDEPGQLDHPPEVAAELVAGSEVSLERALATLAEVDVAIVQHEFGIYGGPDGVDVLELVERLEVPAIVVLHTVLADPSPPQRRIIEELGARAAVLVVQSQAARRRLLDAHAVDPHRVHLIPHGAQANPSTSPSLEDPTRSPTVLTWGLIGPGKGIEVAIRAFAELRDLEPPVEYLVLGQTHPRVLHREGERYREALIALAQELGVGDRVHLDNRYYDTSQVLAKVREADLVLLPYHSRDQVVSGVLVEALASSTPVVATAFPHAAELLAGGAGLTVPHDDPGAMANALRRLLDGPAALGQAVERARALVPSLLWSTVGRAYARLATEVCAGATLRS